MQRNTTKEIIANFLPSTEGVIFEKRKADKTEVESRARKTFGSNLRTSEMPPCNAYPPAFESEASKGDVNAITAREAELITVRILNLRERTLILTDNSVLNCLFSWR